MKDGFFPGFSFLTFAWQFRQRGSVSAAGPTTAAVSWKMVSPASMSLLATINLPTLSVNLIENGLHWTSPLLDFERCNSK